ncbi:MAG: hypothetical protein JWN52_4760 [Actinomycetia bacterium]|nr:hypothetical protein [Actinomycetes bacterium]
MTFLGHLHDVAVNAFSSIPTDQARDIYAVSFLIDNIDDDPRLPTLVIGYNTETQVQQTILAGRASGPAEARWNYAFWLQNQLTVIGDPTRDPAGAAAREKWIKDLGLWYDEPADDADWLTAVGPLAQQIEVHFNQACSQLARTLHTTGVITATLGRPVPVLVHELEYYEQIARRTEAANPPGLADDFTAWVRSI